MILKNSDHLFVVYTEREDTDEFSIDVSVYRRFCPNCYKSGIIRRYVLKTGKFII